MIRRNPLANVSLVCLRDRTRSTIYKRALRMFFNQFLHTSGETSIFYTLYNPCDQPLTTEVRGHQHPQLCSWPQASGVRMFLLLEVTGESALAARCS